MTTPAKWSEIVDEDVEDPVEEQQPTDKKSKKKAGGGKGAANAQSSSGLSPSGEGIRTVVEHGINDKGQKVKVTKKIRVYKNIRTINKRVEERRQNWKKFGKCAGVEGIEPAVTSLCEEVPLVLGDEERKKKEKMLEDKQDVEEIKREIASLIAAGNMPTKPGAAGGPGGAAAAGAAPAGPTAWRPKFDRTGKGGGPTSTTASSSKAPKEGAYVAPRLRDRGPGGQSDDEATIRVTNLSEEITEEDLKERFRQWGDIARVFLAKDKVTQKSKGFAFINYKSKSSAQAAMDNMNGKGWEHLIVNIEWAKPSGSH